MRNLLALAAVVLGIVSVSAETTAANRSEAVLRLLNSSAAGSPRAYAEAAAIVAADAAAGKPLPQFVMAICADEKSMPEKLRPSAETREKYLRASRGRIGQLAEKDGNPLAMYLLAIEGGDTNLLRRAAEGGNVQAANAWGTALMREVDGPLPDPAAKSVMARAFGFFRDAAATGDANGLYNLGMCYARGLGVEVDDDKALGFFRAAAEKGQPQAVNNLGWFHLKGRGVPEDPVEAAKCFAKSADYGNPEGQLNYALALIRGEGVPVNERTAASLLLASARQDNADAMNIYGMCVLKGRGVKPSPEIAFRWFRASADLGHPMAMDNLASCYEQGLGVAVSAEEAKWWRLRSLAVRGDEDARRQVAEHDAAKSSASK